MANIKKGTEKASLQQAVWQYGGVTNIFSTFSSLIDSSSCRRIKPSNRINNELLFINLAAVTGWRISNAATSPSRTVACNFLITANSYFYLVVVYWRYCKFHFDNKVAIFRVVLAGSVAVDAIKYTGNKPFCTSATVRTGDNTHSAGAKRAIVACNFLTTANSYFYLVVVYWRYCKFHFDNKVAIFRVVLTGSVAVDAIKYTGNKPFCTSATVRKSWQFKQRRRKAGNRCRQA